MMLDPTEIYMSAHGLHFWWHWEVKGQGHNPLIRDILKTGWTPGRTFLKAAMGFRLAVRFDLGWPWGVKNQSHSFYVKYVEKGYDVGPNELVTSGHIDSTSLDLLPKIFDLVVLNKQQSVVRLDPGSSDSS